MRVLLAVFVFRAHFILHQYIFIYIYIVYIHSTGKHIVYNLNYWQTRTYKNYSVIIYSRREYKDFADSCWQVAFRHRTLVITYRTIVNAKNIDWKSKCTFLTHTRRYFDRRVIFSSGNRRPKTQIYKYNWRCVWLCECDSRWSWFCIFWQDAHEV